MIQERFAFVDIETTGGSFIHDRILEIAVILVEKNTIVSTYQTLINPQRSIPSAILALTGIREKELMGAPSFEEIHARLFEYLEGASVVAHNARFDVGFLKNEFARLGKKFHPRTLCTVQLSRKVFAGQQRHNLDALIERLGVSCANRHRAYDDALVLYEFFRHLESRFSEQELADLLRHVRKEGAVPPALTPEKLQALPDTPGVYIFYDADGAPLYVGKSIHVRERVLSHFHQAMSSPKELKIFQKVAQIEVRPTAGELGALLLETELVKELQPLYNRRLRRTRLLTVLRRTAAALPYESAEIDYLEQIDTTSFSEILGVFRTKRQAEQYLEEIAKIFFLCKKMLGLEKTKKECFGFQLGRCQGSCRNEEDPKEYNIRFSRAFQKTALKSWPYHNILAVEEKNDEGGGEVFFLHDWCLVAKGRYSDFGLELEELQPRSFDHEQYKILHRYLARRPRGLQLRQLSFEQFRQLTHITH